MESQPLQPRKNGYDHIVIHLREMEQIAFMTAFFRLVDSPKRPAHTALELREHLEDYYVRVSLSFSEQLSQSCLRSYPCEAVQSEDTFWRILVMPISEHDLRWLTRINDLRCKGIFKENVEVIDALSFVEGLDLRTLILGSENEANMPVMGRCHRGIWDKVLSGYHIEVFLNETYGAK